jgi:thiol-disulfide isomerase/thioredoxin
MTKLLYFTADWCTPCKKVRPLLLEVMQEFPDLEIEFMDADTERGAVQELSIQAVPTLVNPVTRDRIQAQASREALRYSINELLRGKADV